MDNRENYRCFLLNTETRRHPAGPVVLRLRRSVGARAGREPVRPVVPGFDGTPLKALLKDIARRSGRSSF